MGLSPESVTPERLAQLEQAEKERDELRLKLQAMHRRAQRAEGLLLKSEAYPWFDIAGRRMVALTELRAQLATANAQEIGELKAALECFAIYGWRLFADLTPPDTTISAGQWDKPDWSPIPMFNAALKYSALDFIKAAHLCGMVDASAALELAGEKNDG